MSYQYPNGTTHVLNSNVDNRVEFYKEVGVSREGFPTYVRWINSRNDWAKVDQAFDNVRMYATKL